jgi:hypothetical protein
LAEIRRTAVRLAPAKAAVVAISTTGDAKLDEYDEESTIIFKMGQLPAHCEDMNTTDIAGAKTLP